MPHLKLKEPRKLANAESDTLLSRKELKRGCFVKHHRGISTLSVLSIEVVSDVLMETNLTRISENDYVAALFYSNASVRVLLYRHRLNFPDPAPQTLLISKTCLQLKSSSPVISL